jgi:predicted outer membrane lipoprotein
MTPLLEIAGWSLIHFVWQGCAIGVIAAVALRLTERRAVPAWR